MKARTSGPGKDFHEGPLVFFSALATAGAGIAVARPLAWPAGRVAWLPEPAEAGAAAALILLGLAVSLAHLGRPMRAPQAARRAGRNPVSNEVLLAAAAGSGAAVTPLLPPISAAVAWAVAALSGLGLLASIGCVYALPARPSWAGAAGGMPMLEGIAFGLLCLPDPEARRMAHYPLLADLAVLLFREWRAARALDCAEPVNARLFRRRGTFTVLRILLLPAAAAAFLAGSHRWQAVAAAGAGILIERFCFYALALRRTTESEVRRIEAILRRTV